MSKSLMIAVLITVFCFQGYGADKSSTEFLNEKQTPQMIPSSRARGNEETEASREIVTKFYEAVVKRDIEAAKQYLHDWLIFYGVFETYHGPNEYLSSLKGLLGITNKLEVRAIIADGNNVAILFDLDTREPAKADTLVAEWHQIADGKIYRVRSAFDARPFAKMFEGEKK